MPGSALRRMSNCQISSPAGTRSNGRVNGMRTRRVQQDRPAACISQRQLRQDPAGECLGVPVWQPGVKPRVRALPVARRLLRRDARVEALGVRLERPCRRSSPRRERRAGRRAARRRRAPTELVASSRYAQPPAGEGTTRPCTVSKRPSRTTALASAATCRGRNTAGQRAGPRAGPRCSRRTARVITPHCPRPASMASNSRGERVGEHRTRLTARP